MAVKVALRIAILIFMALLAGRWESVAADPPADQVPTVVILNSYHQGYKWSDGEIEGLLAGLKAVYPGMSPAIEHLDLKRFSGEDYENRLSGFLADKYRNRKIDLAVILDNPAFDLILSRRNEILPGVPVVFAGVNDFTPVMLKGQNRVTGVAEVQDYQGTLSQALALQPATRRVFAVHDYTATGRAVRREMEAVLPAFRDRVQVTFNAPATFEEMAAQIAVLPPDSMVLILSFITDSDGKALTSDQSTAVLTAQARVPVYAMHETRLGYGIVGGMLIGGAEHGRRAAVMALRVLAGEDPASIPVEIGSTSRPMFDYLQLKRFHISLDALPTDSTLVNRPVSFYEQHKTVLLGVACIFALLLGLIGCLLVLLHRKKTAERALRESEECYRIVADNTYDWEYWADPQGRFLYVSPSCKRISGYSAEEFMKRADLWLDIILPEDKPKWDVHSCVATHRQKAEEIEIRIQRADGEVRWISHVCRPVFDPKGPFLGSRGSNRDVTKRVRMEVTLRDSEERHRRIIESASDAILLRSEGIVIYANPAALKLFRANHPGDLIGKQYLDLVHPDDRTLSAERVKKNIDENWTASLREHRILTLDGQMVHVESTGVPVKYRGETQVFGVFRDITARKLGDQEKGQIERQLQQAQKMEAIGTLAGGIAHDFNNILSVIVGNAEILGFSTSVDDSSQGGLNQILAASQRAKLLVRQILAFSRHGKQEKMLIDLKPIVKESLEFLRASLPTSIELRSYLDPTSGTIMADPTQVQQVLMNLCTNAGHAMEKEGGSLQIKLSNTAITGEDARFDPEVEPGNYVKITVSDTGHGMEPSVLQRIFEPYFTTKEPSKGTGLGLAVVHGIVKSHGGKIKACLSGCCTRSCSGSPATPSQMFQAQKTP
jgi:PAS domain S-box-containing protein